MKLDLSHTRVEDTIVVHSKDDVISIFEAMADVYPDSDWSKPLSADHRSVYLAATEFSSSFKYAIRCDKHPNGAYVGTYKDWGFPIHEITEFIVEEPESSEDISDVEALL